MSKNKIIFTGLQIVVWIIFVGLSIEAAALLVNFVFSLYNPDFVQNLYQKLDLSELYTTNKPVYWGVYGFIISLSLLKVYLFYMVIQLTLSLNLANPFQRKTARQIIQISYMVFSVGLISHIAREISTEVLNNAVISDKINSFWVDSEAFILTSAIIFIVAYIFNRGVEIQNENDLTV